MSIIMTYKSGLASNPNPDLFEVGIEQEEIVLKQIQLKAIGSNKVLQTYKIPLKNVVTCGLVTEQEIITKDKSVVGRGIAGALLLGPAGLVLGGMSGIGAKKKKKNINLFVISYLSEKAPENVQSFVLDTDWNNNGLKNIKFAKKAQKIVQEIEKSDLVKTYIENNIGDLNIDGSITL